MKKYIALAGTYAFPFMVFAQADVTDLRGVVEKVKGIIDLIVPLLISLAFLWFLWGVFQYVTRKGAEDMEKARDTIVYGLLGIFLMLAVWGLVNIIANTFDIQTGGEIQQQFPVAPQTSGS